MTEFDGSVPGSDKLLCPAGIAFTTTRALREALADPEWHRYHDAIRAELDARKAEPVPVSDPEREQREAMAF